MLGESGILQIDGSTCFLSFCVCVCVTILNNKQYLYHSVPVSFSNNTFNFGM